MEKIIVDFEEVRGLGNITIPKTSDDFETYLCSITEENRVVAGAFRTVYRMKYQGKKVVVTVAEQYVKSGGTLTVTAKVTNENGEPVSGASVELFKEVAE